MPSLIRIEVLSGKNYMGYDKTKSVNNGVCNSNRVLGNLE